MLPIFPLLDRKDAIALFEDFLHKENIRILLIKGETMMGKSRVLQEYIKTSESRKIDNVFIDMKTKNEEVLLLYEIAQQIDSNLFPNFLATYSKFINQQHTNVSQVNQFFSRMVVRDDSDEKLNKYRLLELRSAFFLDLDLLPKDVEYLVVIDSFDAATETVKRWLTEDFIIPISKKRKLKIIVAGIIIPYPSAIWEKSSQLCELISVTKEDCIDYCKTVGIEVDEKIINEFFLFLQEGRPGSFIQYVLFKKGFK